ncbi:DUF2243 domain-containing protein [Halomicrobium urmianum]|uniref:DUF2243 domain-containing protein n=1 Tax=Halomicrobium urmianum TaxID=1586233 RepID=UPI001CD91C6C|nr:DUF2243 domain-containing protein [Halomicrobium urmianum]
MNATAMTRRALPATGVFGFGFSGLIDVLVFHHRLQWHRLHSEVGPMDTVTGLRTNVLADGFFSIGMVAVMTTGAGLRWQSERRTPVPLAVRPLAGAAAVGLGAFDVFDAGVDSALQGRHQPVGQGRQPLSFGGSYNLHVDAVASCSSNSARTPCLRGKRSPDSSVPSNTFPAEAFRDLLVGRSHTRHRRLVSGFVPLGTTVVVKRYTTAS